MRSAWAANIVGLCLLISACQTEPEVLFEKESTHQINGSEVYVKRLSYGTNETDAMRKEALVVVHGGPVLDHSYFSDYLNDLARDYQLVFYDQRACGKSSVEVDTEKMTLDAFVEDIELLRTELNLDKINLLGHSWGGLLAMKYGIKYADKLDKLILSNSMAPSAADWQRENALVGAKVTQQDLDERSALMSSGALQSEDPREAIKTLLLQSFKYQMYDSANLKRLDLFVPIDYTKRSQVFGGLGAGLNTYDLYADLGKITCPTLLVYGETEPASDLYTDKMLAQLPRAELKVVEKAGHFPFLEQTVSYNEVVKAFLND